MLGAATRSRSLLSIQFLCLRASLIATALVLIIGFAPAHAVDQPINPLVAPIATSRTDVLVVANANYVGSADVASYYASKRNIPTSNILQVHVPTTYIVTRGGYESLRDQILNFLLTHRLNTTDPAPICGTGHPYYCNVKAAFLRAHTEFRYIVLMPGVPSLFFDTAATGQEQYNVADPSVDAHLQKALLNYTSVGAFPSTGPVHRNREIEFGDGRGMRLVNAGADGEFIVGRISGQTTEAALALVDRTIAAEGRGLYGKLYSSRYGRHQGKADWPDYQNGGLVYGAPTALSGTTTTGTSWRYQLGLWGDTAGSCSDYLENSSQSAGVAPLICGVRMNNGEENPPGVAGGRFPDPVNAVAYLGSLNGQPTSGKTHTFDRVLNWKHGTDQCEGLCENLATTGARADCRAASVDVFKEINSSCVGVSPGFIGYNYQSFPVAFYANWPTGWYFSGSESNGGDWEDVPDGDVKTPFSLPLIRTDDGYGADQKSLWFGTHGQLAGAKCYAGTDFSAAATETCDTRQRGIIAQRIDFPQAHTFTSASPAQYELRFRAKSTQQTVIPVDVYFLTRDASSSQQVYESLPQYMEIDPARRWNDGEYVQTLTVDPASVT